MARGTITYNHAQIAELTAQTDSSSAFFTDVLAGLKTDVDRLGSDWAGLAAPAYRDHQDQWNQAANSLQALLGEISAAVRGGSETMLEADRAASKVWNL